jgi:hypothetical protein
VESEHAPVGLSRAVLLGPLSITCLACIALAVVKSEVSNPSDFFDWFVAVAPVAVLQALLLVPLGLRWLRHSPEQRSRWLSVVATGLVALSLLALAVASPW